MARGWRGIKSNGRVTQYRMPRSIPNRRVFTSSGAGHVLSALSPDVWVPLNDLGDGVVDINILRGLGPVVFTRTTPAICRLANGLLKKVIAGVPRSHYLADGTYAGYLTENARTNLCLRSEEFDHAVWTSTATVVPNVAIAPDGTLTADSLADNDAGAFHSKNQGIAIPNDNATYAVSLFVKKTTILPTAVLGINLSLSGGVGVNTNPRLNTVSGVAGGSGTPVVESWGDYWRITGFITNNTSGNTALGMNVYPAARMSADETVGGADDAAAIGTNIVWGAQVEAATGNCLASSTYIPTLGASVVRNGDRINGPLANINQAQGSAYAEVGLPADGRTIHTGIWLGSASNGYMLYGGGVALTLTQISDGNTPNAQRAGLSNLSTGIRKRASSWNTNYKAVTGDGLTVGSTPNYHGTLGTTPNGFHIGTSTSGDQPFGTIKNVKLWNRQLSDADLEYLTR